MAKLKVAERRSYRKLGPPCLWSGIERNSYSRTLDMPTNYSTKRSIKPFPRAIHLPSREILMRREGICVNDGPVCTENLIRIDWLEESPNVVAPWLLWYRFSSSLVGSLPQAEVAA